MKNIIESFKKKIEKRNKLKNRFYVMGSGDWYFDSSKADLIFKYFDGENHYALYLTDKGNWIEIKNKSDAQILNADYVKSFMKANNKMELYKQYFGELEEI